MRLVECRNCQCWLDAEYPASNRVLAVDEEVASEEILTEGAECHRHAPRPYPLSNNKSKGDFEDNVHWPMTAPYEGCFDGIPRRAKLRKKKETKL